MISALNGRIIMVAGTLSVVAGGRVGLYDPDGALAAFTEFVAAHG